MPHPHLINMLENYVGSREYSALGVSGRLRSTVWFWVDGQAHGAIFPSARKVVAHNQIDWAVRVESTKQIPQ